MLPQPAFLAQRLRTERGWVLQVVCVLRAVIRGFHADQRSSHQHFVCDKLGRLQRFFKAIDKQIEGEAVDSIKTAIQPAQSMLQEIAQTSRNQQAPEETL